MKLSNLEIEKVKEQTTVEPMLGDHPAMPHLKTYIGDHSFYIGSEGVVIWEYVSGDEKEGEHINALRVASWADPAKRTIAMHNPQLTETIISLSEDTTAEDWLPKGKLWEGALDKKKMSKTTRTP